MKLYFSFCFLLMWLAGTAQVNFMTVSLKEAFQQARKEGKLVFLQFKAAGCTRCNEIVQKAMENTKLTGKMEQAFVCLEINEQHPDRDKIAATYSLNSAKSFGTLFLDDNGTLLHSYLRTTTNWKDYLKQIDIVFEKTGETLKITELEREYRNGNKSFGLLEVLLQKRKALRLPTDSLLEEYVTALPSDSLQSVEVLKFIAQMAPLPNSNADRILRSNHVIFNRAWYSMDLPVRVSINNAIISKGMQKAIAEKSEAYAIRTATFAQNTNSNTMAGAKAFDKNMLRYYSEVKDTTNYFRKSIAYFEQYFLSVTSDSIKRLDSANMKRMFSTAKKDTIVENNRMRISASIITSPMGQEFSKELNNGAYQFYSCTENPYLLSIATEWSKKALEFFETPEAMDTYAKLLYKQAQKEAALEVMNKAIILQQKQGFPADRFTATLEKMKKNLPLKD